MDLNYNKMKKYKVSLYLMVNPSEGDSTITKKYIVEAKSEWEAYSKAEELQSNDSPDIKYLSVFNYKIKEL